MIQSVIFLSGVLPDRGVLHPVSATAGQLELPQPAGAPSDPARIAWRSADRPHPGLAFDRSSPARWCGR